MQYRDHEDSPLTSIRIEEGAVIVTMEFDTLGCVTRLHSHTFDHWLTCIKGSARVVIDGVETIVREGDRYLVEAHKQHGVFPLETGSILECRHEHDDIHLSDKPHDGIPMEWLSRLTESVNHASR